VKSGHVQGRQRYQCKVCGYHYTVALKSTAKPLSLKKQALHLYLEGLGFRSIGRILGVSHVAVLQWIKAFGRQEQALQKEPKAVEVVEMDEMHTYLCQKKTTAGYGLLLIELGKSSSASWLAIGAPKRASACGKK
jgi:hypothetical protein